MSRRSSSRQWLIGLAPIVPLAIIFVLVRLFWSAPEPAGRSKPRAVSAPTSRPAPVLEDPSPPTEDEPEPTAPVVEELEEALGSTLVTFKDAFAAGGDVAGYLWHAADKNGTHLETSCSPEANCFVGEPTALCVKGTLGQVQGSDWVKHWGAALGWNVAQQVEPGSPLGVLTATDVVGFEFDLQTHTGSVAEVRLSLSTGGTEFCVPLRPGKNTVRWEDMKESCWKPDGASLDPWAEAITAIKWQIIPREDATTAFDFCVAGLTVLR